MENLRIEKKFVLGKYKDIYLKKFLLHSRFNKQYPEREISSIYLDTINYDYARDNINGVSTRKKIRFRWYDDKLNKIYMEEKNKKNFTVWKDIKKIDFINDKNEILNQLQDYLLKDKINLAHNFNYKFILKTNYKRSYWISCDKNIRATIDVDINASALNNLSIPISLPDTVLEFKFSPKNESIFRNFFKENSSYLRSQKYSKYVRSFIALEEAGYKI